MNTECPEELHLEGVHAMRLHRTGEHPSLKAQHLQGGQQFRHNYREKC
jgi:hypothetical protein